MANTFFRKSQAAVGTANVVVGSYTVGANTKTVVLGLGVSNTTGSAIAVDVFVNDSTNSSYYLVKSAPVAAGGALVVIGGDQKLVLQAGDNVKVKSDTLSSADVNMSIMEIT